VKIWSFLPKTYKLKLETTLDGLHTKTISCVDWSFDGKRLAISSFDATISIWLR
jgi:WD40 repeat protein